MNILLTVMAAIQTYVSLGTTWKKSRFFGAQYIELMTEVALDVFASNRWKKLEKGMNTKL